MNANKLSGMLLDSLGTVVRATDYRPSAKNATAGACRHVITISREAGARGTTVARAVGDLLGWPVYDRELLDRVGKEMGTHTDMVKLIDEKPMGWLEQCVCSLVSEYNLSHDSYMVHLIATVRALGAQGHCVIVGRGSNFLLPHETTLNIRLVGDLKDRIAWIQQEHKVSEKEAAHWVEKTNNQRHDFVKRHFGKEVADLKWYDLGLNTSRLSVAECADVIVTAMHRIQARTQAGKRQHASV